MGSTAGGEELSSAVFGMRGEGIVARGVDGYSSQTGKACGCRSREGSELGQVGRSWQGALPSQGTHGRHMCLEGTAEVGCRSLGLSQRWGSPSYLLRNRTLGPPLENNPKTPPSSRDEGLRLLHGLETNLATSLQTPQEA